MKKSFQILQDRPKVMVTLTRDSVCAGDDCDAPHQEKREIYSFTDPAEFAKECSSAYLPTIAGMGHSWDCLLNKARIARITCNSIEPLIRGLEFETENSVHFQYHSAAY